MHLLSRANHLELTHMITVSPDNKFLDRVAASIPRQRSAMLRRPVIAASLVMVRDLEETGAVANRIAPEPVKLSVRVR